jgi:phosphatidylglycerol:prolipoprotein diacylglycerol transferase
MAQTAPSPQHLHRYILGDPDPGGIIQPMAQAYPLIFSIGALLSLIWLGFWDPLTGGWARSLRSALSAETRLDLGFVTLLTGLVGARLGFILLHLPYYTSRPIEMLTVWEGGLSWVGGFFGALLGACLHTAWRRVPFWNSLDALAIPATLMALASWTGCLMDGCAYGRAGTASLLQPMMADMFGEVAPRWPTQIVGMLTCVAAIGMILATAGRVRPGSMAFISALVISSTALGLSFTRGDPVMLLMGFRADTVGAALSLGFALIGGIALLFTR